MQFEWDAAKAAVNLAKHGISFDQATRVFADPARLTVLDTRHTAETRENTTGLVAGVIILTFAAVSRSENCGQTPGGQQAATVPHTSRAGVIRLISARPASRQERKDYHANR
jgi:uncharacterized DUF497 family protein